MRTRTVAGCLIVAMLTPGLALCSAEAAATSHHCCPAGQCPAPTDESGPSHDGPAAPTPICCAPSESRQPPPAPSTVVTLSLDAFRTTPALPHLGLSPDAIAPPQPSPPTPRSAPLHLLFSVFLV